MYSTVFHLRLVEIIAAVRREKPGNELGPSSMEAGRNCGRSYVIFSAVQRTGYSKTTDRATSSDE